MSDRPDIARVIRDARSLHGAVLRVLSDATDTDLDHLRHALQLAHDAVGGEIVRRAGR